MFEEFSRRNRAVMAAMTLAATRGWSDVGLADIAKEANLTMADLRREFVCKNDILRAFQAEVDAQVLARSKPAGPDDSVRDQVFDALMTRFDVMTPQKEALKHIAAYFSLPSWRGLDVRMYTDGFAILDARECRCQA